MILIMRWLYRKLRQRHAQTQPATPRQARSPAGGARAGATGPLRLTLHQARYDLLSFLRNRQALFFTLLLPIIFLIIFVGVFGNETVGTGNVEAATYYVPGLSALAVIAATFVNLVVSITTQRETGILKRRRATPVPAWVLIAGRTLTATAVALVTMGLVLLIGRFAYGVTLPSSTIPGVALTALTGSITFCCLGYAFSTVIGSADSAQPMVQAITLPLYFISGVFILNTRLPAWLQNVAKFFPVEHLADGLHHAFDPAATGSGIVGSDLAVLAAWALVGLIVALLRFTWTPSGAST
ncbi:MAG TPA: ABC transporter permease [Streptosporangiaceae bacterium]